MGTDHHNNIDDGIGTTIAARNENNTTNATGYNNTQKGKSHNNNSPIPSSSGAASSPFGFEGQNAHRRRSWEGDDFGGGIYSKNRLDTVPPFAYYSPSGGGRRSYDEGDRLLSYEAYYRHNNNNATDVDTNTNDYGGTGLSPSTVGGGGGAAMSHLMSTWGGDGGEKGTRIFAAGEVLCGLLAPITMMPTTSVY